MNLFEQIDLTNPLSDRVFIIAEMSANHNHSFDIAKKTVYAAKEAGADAIKFQTYTADTLTLDCDRSCFQIKQGTLWDNTTLYKLYQQAYTPWEWQPKLKKLAEELGLICFSSPFDNSSADFLEQMEVPAYKIASFEITDLPLIKYVAAKGKPLLISTGIATLSEIEEAVEACHSVGNHAIALLKCTSSYPAPVELANLRTIPDLKKRFNIVVGLSDHTTSESVAIASVALGARIIEKHFILDRSIGGPDAAFSMEKNDFAHMVGSIREVEKALGAVSYELNDLTRKNRKFARSLFVTQTIKKGEKFTAENVRSIRPNDGLPPKYLSQIIGKTALQDLSKGTPLAWNLIK